MRYPPPEGRPGPNGAGARFDQQIILAASIGLGFFNEYRAERAAAKLHGP
jgi:hypothetical protein